jgi:hypothetical protein
MLWLGDVVYNGVMARQGIIFCTLYYGVKIVEFCFLVLWDPVGGSSKGSGFIALLEKLVWEAFFCGLESSLIVLNVHKLEGTKYAYFLR